MKRHLLAALATLAIACSASSPESPGGSGGTGHEGGGAPTAQRHPSGAAPTMVGGLLGVSHVQAGSGAAKDSAGGMFFDSPQSAASSQYQDVLTGYAGVPLGTCAELPVINISSGQPQPLDAGELSVVAPDGQSYPVAKIPIPGFAIYNGDLPAAAFTPLGHYQLVATGAAVSAFTGDFWTPGDLTLTAPAASGTLAAPMSKALDLAWQGTADGEPVIVRITQVDRTVTCRVPDTGSFSIPASAFAAFQPSASVERPLGDAAVDQLTVERIAWYTIATGSAPTLVVVSVGAQYDLDLQ